MSDRPLKIAYIMSHFPSVTETFILYEILEMAHHDIYVELYPLIRTKERVKHPGLDRALSNSHFLPLLSIQILKTNLCRFIQQPFEYLSLLWKVISGTWGNFKFISRAIALFPQSVHCATVMQQQGIDHIHAHFATHPALSALIINSLTSIPFSFTAHGSDIHKDQRMLDKKIESASFVVMISEYNKRFVSEKVGEQSSDKMRVIHCGVDLDYFTRSAEKTHNDSFCILCVASLREVKGHRYLLEACRYLKDSKMTFVCHLVGEGQLRHEIEKQIADLNLTDMVIMHGALPRQEVIKLMQQADVMVLSSIQASQGEREGIPVVLMEAMACELPVIASRISGIPELVANGKTGILVSPGNSRAIAESLQKLRAEPENGFRMGRDGRMKVQTEFNIHKNTGELAQLFRKTKKEQKKITYDC